MKHALIIKDSTGFIEIEAYGLRYAHPISAKAHTPVKVKIDLAITAFGNIISEKQPVIAQRIYHGRYSIGQVPGNINGIGDGNLYVAIINS